ncbi:MAG: nuclear transport factor 2 family protein [Bacteroidota bacterium]
MKYTFPILLLLAACQTTKNFDATAATNNIHQVIDDWHKAAADADFDAYFGAMSEGAIFIGTDATENWTKEEFAAFCRPYFDKGKAWSFTPFDRHIYFSVSGQTAWFDELLETWMGTCIGSGVLERKGDEWTIEHYVLSVKIPNESVQDVIEVKAAQDSLFLNRYEREN